MNMYKHCEVIETKIFYTTYEKFSYFPINIFLWKADEFMNKILLCEITSIFTVTI